MESRMIRIDRKGRILIPKDLRDKYDFHPGDHFEFDIDAINQKVKLRKLETIEKASNRNDNASIDRA